MTVAPMGRCCEEASSQEEHTNPRYCHPHSKLARIGRMQDLMTILILSIDSIAGSAATASKIKGQAERPLHEFKR